MTVASRSLDSDNALHLEPDDVASMTPLSPMNRKVECVMFALQMGGTVPITGRAAELADFFEQLASDIRVIGAVQPQTIVLRGVTRDREIPF